VRDISPEGIGLVLNGYLEVGTFLNVNLSTATRYARPLRARVVRTQRIGKRTWILGCVLNPPLRPEELEALL